MEMRLGKTLVAIRWLEQFFLQKILVIAPRPVLTTWQDELAGECISSTILRGSFVEVRTAIQEPMVRWFLVNYEALYHIVEEKKRPILSQIAQAQWDAVVYDESTSLRNPQAVRTQICRRAFKNVEYRTCLSGLPNPESYLDFFEQFFAVYGEFAGCKDYWHFRYRFFNQIGYDWVLRPGAREQLKQLMAGQAFFLQRTAVRHFKEKVHEKRMVELPQDLRIAYDILEEEWAVGDRETKYRIVVNNWLNRLAAGSALEPQFTSRHKLDELLSLLKGELEGQQVVVWATYNNQIESVLTLMEKAGISAYRMTGEDSPEKQESVRLLFRKQKFQVLACQIRIGKFGLDFSNAAGGIYISNNWEYELRSQSEDRHINLKKHIPSLIVDILTEDTIEEDIYRALRKKGQTAKQFNMDVSRFTMERLRRRQNDQTRRTAEEEIRREKVKADLRKNREFSAIGI